MPHGTSIDYHFASCPAMIVHGLIRANTVEAIKFCTDKCPYPDECVLMDGKRGPKVESAKR